MNGFRRFHRLDMESTENTPSSSLKRMRPEDSITIDPSGQSPPKRPREAEPVHSPIDTNDSAPKDKGKQRMVDDAAPTSGAVSVQQKNEKLVSELELELRWVLFTWEARWPPATTVCASSASHIASTSLSTRVSYNVLL